MADSKQLDILKALVRHLEGINPENDYDEDLRGRVFRNRMVFGEDVGVEPFLAINEAPRPNPVDTAGSLGVSRKEDWDLLVQGWTREENDVDPADGVYQLKAMVEQHLTRLLASTNSGMPTYPDEYLLGGRVTIIRIGQGIVRQPDQAGTGRICFYLPITLTRTADLANPFVAE